MIDPGGEHHLSPVRVPVRDASVGLPVVDLRNGLDARGGEPGGDALLGSKIRQVEHQLIKCLCLLRRIFQSDDLYVNLPAGQAKDHPVQAVAVVEGL